MAIVMKYMDCKSVNNKRYRVNNQKRCYQVMSLIEESVMKQIVKDCKKNDITKSEVVRRALMYYFGDELPALKKKS